MDKNHQAKVTPGKGGGPKRLYAHIHPLVDFMREGLMRSHFKPHSNKEAQFLKAPMKKRKVALWLGREQVAKCGIWGYGFHDLQADEELPRRRVEWKQPRTTNPGLRAIPALAACESLPSHTPALM